MPRIANMQILPRVFPLQQAETLILGSQRESGGDPVCVTAATDVVLGPVRNQFQAPVAVFGFIGYRCSESVRGEYTSLSRPRQCP